MRKFRTNIFSIATTSNYFWFRISMNRQARVIAAVTAVRCLIEHPARKSLYFQAQGLSCFQEEEDYYGGSMTHL